MSKTCGILTSRRRIRWSVMKAWQLGQRFWISSSISTAAVDKTSSLRINNHKKAGSRKASGLWGPTYSSSGFAESQAKSVARDPETVDYQSVACQSRLSECSLRDCRLPVRMPDRWQIGCPRSEDCRLP